MTKHELRCSIRKQKKQYSAAQLAAMSEEITDRVLASAIWQEAGTLLLYHPLPDEVDVCRLIRLASAEGKRVLLPVCNGDNLELRIYVGEASLCPGAFGIMEPTGPLFPSRHYNQIRLALIPGMAFDKAGHRLGRGKGYYDRLLPHLSAAYLLGVGFPFQLVDMVPTETHDISVNEIIV